MQRRRLGRTNLSVSEIGIGGAWLLGRDADQPHEYGAGIVRRALELGVTYLDTSECYLGGQSEGIFGAALRGHQGEHVLATKCGHRPKDFDWSRQSVVHSLSR
jgi:D-threo-aldose 1-dehydrogenase